MSCIFNIIGKKQTIKYLFWVCAKLPDAVLWSARQQWWCGGVLRCCVVHSNTICPWLGWGGLSDAFTSVNRSWGMWERVMIISSLLASSPREQFSCSTYYIGTLLLLHYCYSVAVRTREGGGVTRGQRAAFLWLKAPLRWARTGERSDQTERLGKQSERLERRHRGHKAAASNSNTQGGRILNLNTVAGQHWFLLEKIICQI